MMKSGALYPISCVFVIFFSVFSGLSIAVTVPITFIFALATIGKKMEFDFSEYKLELFALILFGLVSLYGITPSNSLKYLARIALIAVTTMMILRNMKALAPIARKALDYLTVATFIAVIFIYIEITTDGVITTLFRRNFQAADRQVFHLSSLDRGSSFLAIFSWVIISYLISKHKKYWALSLYLAILAILPITDSLAGLVAYIAAGVVFVLARYIRLFRNPLFVAFIFSVSVLFICLFVAMMDARELSDNANFLPFSAKHRLFIWEFVVNKIHESKILGYGFAASRFIEVPETAFVTYQGVTLNPLPLHPHNSLLQFILEGGVLGLIIYLVLGCKYILKVGIDFDHYKPSRIGASVAGYSCFVTYYIISLISFSFWQSWWVLATSFILITHRLMKEL